MKESAPLNPAWKQRVRRSLKLLVNTISAHPECLKLARGPATIDLVDDDGAACLRDAVSGPPAWLRMAALKETKDLM